MCVEHTTEATPSDSGQLCHPPSPLGTRRPAGRPVGPKLDNLEDPNVEDLDGRRRHPLGERAKGLTLTGRTMRLASGGWH